MPSPTLSGLRAAWLLNNDTLDSLGLTNGTATNITYDVGVFGASAVFNTTSKIVTGDLSSINSATRFSVSFWCYLNSTASTNDLVTKWNYGTNASWVIRAAGTSIEFAIASTLTDPYNNAVYTPSSTIAAGGWVNVICTYDGSQSGNTNKAKIYVNNVSVGSLSFGTIPSSTTNGTHPVVLGEFPIAYNRLDGKLSDVFIWDRLLTPQERTDLQTMTYPF